MPAVTPASMYEWAMFDRPSPKNASVRARQLALVLLDREQVGEQLARVEVVAERVDHGTRVPAAISSRPACAYVRHTIAATWRSSTRAVSDGVSLPPSWLFAVEMISGVPPRSAMPTANETRVRVEDLSKMTATVCGPARGFSFHRSFFSATARSRISACSAGCQVVVAQQMPGHAVTSFGAALSSVGASSTRASSTVRSDAVNSCDELVDLDVADVERRARGGSSRRWGR